MVVTWGHVRVAWEPFTRALACPPPLNSGVTSGGGGDSAVRTLMKLLGHSHLGPLRPCPPGVVPHGGPTQPVALLLNQS